MTTTPSGCRWCGVTAYDHIGLWSSATDDNGRHVGYHPWTAPPQELIKERMHARRTARQTASNR